MIPGIKSSKYDSLLTPNIKTTKNKWAPMNESGIFRDNSTPQLVTSPNAYYLKQRDNLPTKSQASFTLNHSALSPVSSSQKQFESYNPITNPMPNTVQNPYISRDIQKGRGSEMYLASVANKSFLN